MTPKNWEVRRLKKQVGENKNNRNIKIQDNDNEEQLPDKKISYDISKIMKHLKIT